MSYTKAKFICKTPDCGAVVCKEGSYCRHCSKTRNSDEKFRLFLIENDNKHFCGRCNQKIQIVKRHMYIGVPKFCPGHNAPISKEEAKKRHGWSRGLTKRDPRIKKILKNRKSLKGVTSKLKGKTYEEIHGEVKAKELREQRSLTFKKKKTKKHREKIGLFRRGKTYEELYGKEKAQKLKKATGLRMRNRVVSSETREKMGKHKRGKSFIQIYGKSRAAEIIEKRLNSWNKNRDENIKKTLKAINKGPNRFEERALSYLNLVSGGEFKYTGEGSLIINGKSADAYSKKFNTVALFNGKYWHLERFGMKINKKNKLKVERVERKPFLDAGYNVVFIWEDELNEVLK